MKINDIKNWFLVEWVIILYKRLVKHDVFGLSTQLAYFFLLSLFPLLITIFSLLPFLPIREEDILFFIEDFAPGETVAFIQNNLSEVLGNHSGKLLSFGIVATIWSASLGMNAIIRAVNRAYEVKENRRFFIVRGMSALLTIAMIGVFLLALLLPVFGKQIGLYLFSKFGLTAGFLKVWNTLRWGLSSIILLLVFSALYLLTPNKKMKDLTFFPGALFSTVGWMAVSSGFSYYVGNFANYSMTYGSLGVIIVLMIWFNLSGIIIILGGEINAIWDSLKKKKKSRK
ncbi:YihY/virulence factor BrkB family protein [Fervidibacillus halotolerans]|uniref:YihY/virulence factor BrkB family protein n=1 Tax=Fervidibacillus halotolerans TaxID=2980027 RepID=A0A9E8RYF3_9BACI|nr:YihY/virulence factor BrkB family protein [Fervidibacillus halotolerans]WAA12781.1 YihY/virulence factor BrkB family protein [Fervidibacillus halotolerans]